MEKTMTDTKNEMNEDMNDSMFDLAMSHTISWKELWEDNKEFKDKKAVVFLPVSVKIAGVEYNAMTMAKFKEGTCPILARYTEDDGFELCLPPKLKEMLMKELNDNLGRSLGKVQDTLYKDKEELAFVIKRHELDRIKYTNSEEAEWSQERVARFVTTLLKESNELRNKCKYCGDVLIVGQAVASILLLFGPVFTQTMNQDTFGLLNGVIKVYMVGPDMMDPDYALIYHNGREGRVGRLIEYVGLKDSIKPAESIGETN